MKSVRWRLAIWFGISVLLLLTAFTGFTYHYLRSELHQKSWQKNYPDHPDWKLHGSYSEAEVADIMEELIEMSLRYGIPLVVAAFAIGFVLSNNSLRPIARLNEQLQMIRAPDLSKRIELPEADAEFRDLVRNVNDLLSRLERAFADMSEYAAKVAHELRTPLAILRLKVEHAGDRIPPELAEQLQSELHQLTHVVDQSLLIAKAEQGRLKLQPRELDLSQLVLDVTEDFTLLAQEEGRTVRLVVLSSGVVLADPKYTKQMLHNLLTNAFKHGQGDIRVKLTRTAERLVLTIANWLRAPAAPEPEALGLGLRVVETLLSLQPDVKCLRRRNPRGYAVRVSFPAPTSTGFTSANTGTAPPAFDAGI